MGAFTSCPLNPPLQRGGSQGSPDLRFGFLFSGFFFFLSTHVVDTSTTPKVETTATPERCISLPELMGQKESQAVWSDLSGLNAKERKKNSSGSGTHNSGWCQGTPRGKTRCSEPLAPQVSVAGRDWQKKGTRAVCRLGSLEKKHPAAGSSPPKEDIDIYFGAKPLLSGKGFKV